MGLSYASDCVKLTVIYIFRQIVANGILYLVSAVWRYQFFQEESLSYNCFQGLGMYAFLRTILYIIYGFLRCSCCPKCQACSTIQVETVFRLVCKLFVAFVFRKTQTLQLFSRTRIRLFSRNFIQFPVLQLLSSMFKLRFETVFRLQI